MAGSFASTIGFSGSDSFLQQGQAFPLSAVIGLNSLPAAKLLPDRLKVLKGNSPENSYDNSPCSNQHFLWVFFHYQVFLELLHHISNASP